MTLTASRALTYVGAEPSYIRIVPDTLDQLPLIDFDHIPLPDGTVTHLLKPSSRITPEHRSLLATIPYAGHGWAAFLHGADGWSPNHPAQRWSLQGLRFAPQIKAVDVNNPNNNTGWGNWVFSLYADGGTPLGSAGPDATMPKRFIVNQCFIDGDQDNYGQGMGKVGRMGMEYMAFVNNWVSGNWSDLYGDQFEMFEISGNCKGPYQIENNYLPMQGDNVYIVGGHAASCWPDVPSILLRRNDLRHPPQWMPSEMFHKDAFEQPSNWGQIFSVSGGGTTLTKIGGRGWISSNERFWHNPRSTGFAYEPATGVARQIASVNETTSVLTLNTPWPAADGTVVTTYIQLPVPTVIYQSGVSGQVCHTTAGSRVVTLDTPLPTYSHDGVTPIVASPYLEYGPFFYTNDTIPRGDCGFNLPKANDWGPGRNFFPFGPIIASPPYARPRYDPAFGRPWQSGDTTWDPNSCRRRLEIVSIASDRLSFTLASPYFETITMTFSIVACDGLPRLAGMGTKGQLELKVGDRILYEGNVSDVTMPNTLHPQTNDYWDDITATISGDQITLEGGATWSAARKDVVARFITYGGQDPILKRPSPPRVIITGRGFYISAPARYLKSIDSATTATLMPIDPRWNGADALTDRVSAPLRSYLNTGIHWVVQNLITRYNSLNLHGSGVMGSNLSGGHGENPGETDASQFNIIVHDNLYNFSTHNAIQAQAGLNGPVFWWNWPIGVMPPCPGQATLDNDQTNSYTRVSHNAVVNVGPRGASPMFMVVASPSGVSHDTEIANNICDQWSSMFGYYYDTLTSAEVAPKFKQPFTIARNILSRTNAPAAVAANVGTFAPDNTGVPSQANIGFANTNPGDITDPLNYILTDIYTTGTVTIAANGLSATLASGTFPSTVVPGQFFKTATSPTLCRIMSGGTGTATVTWTTPVHPEAGQSGKSYAITFKGTATDGTDPGPNIALLKQFTDGVRRLP